MEYMEQEPNNISNECMAFAQFMAFIVSGNPSEEFENKAAQDTHRLFSVYEQSPSGSDKLEAIRLEAIKQRELDVQYIKDPLEISQLAEIRVTVVLSLCLDNLINNSITSKVVDKRKSLKAKKRKKEGNKKMKYTKEELEKMDYEELAELLYYTPLEEFQLEAVKIHGQLIHYIDNPSEAVQLEAVRQNGCAINYIDNPSEAVQLEAVKQDGYAIQFITDPSEAVQLEAVKQDD